MLSCTSSMFWTTVTSQTSSEEEWMNRDTVTPTVTFGSRAGFKKGTLLLPCFHTGGLWALCRRYYDLALDETGDLAGFLAASGTSLSQWSPVLKVDADREPQLHAAVQWLHGGLRQQLWLPEVTTSPVPFSASPPFPAWDCALPALAQSWHSSLSPCMISLLAAAAALSPKLVSLHDFALGCLCRLVFQACLPSWFGFWLPLPPCL